MLCPTHKTEEGLIIKRTKIRDRKLPNYTKGEEITNMISHIAGGLIGVVVLIFGVLTAARKGDAWGVVGAAIYGASFIQLYAISSTYHGLRPGTAKKVLQAIDHCSIYLFIAGTYTPILFSALRPVYPGWAWTLFGLVWGIAVLATTFTAIDLRKFATFSMICYIGMGWCVALAVKPIIEVVPRTGLLLLLFGGIAYTIGAVIYGLGKRRRYMHSLFHLFVVAGSVLQALCVLFYVL